MPQHFQHPTALVSPGAQIGEGTRLWAFTNIQDGAVIGRGCNMCDGCYVERGSLVGDHVTLKNGVYVFDGVTLEDLAGDGRASLADHVATAEFDSRNADLLRRHFNDTLDDEIHLR